MIKQSQRRKVIIHQILSKIIKFRRYRILNIKLTKLQQFATSKFITLDLPLGLKKLFSFYIDNKNK